MHSLPIFVRLTDRPVILVGDGEAAAAKRRMLKRAGAQIVHEHQPAAIAVVAVEDVVEAEIVVTRLKARGILVNAVDRPELSDFTFPAIVDRDPVLVAIGTGGASAGLAKVLRQRIEALLPTALGPFARAMAAARPAMKTRWPAAADRRRAIDAALTSGGVLDPLVHPDPLAVARWVKDSDSVETGKLVSLALISGDPDHLTLIAARLLGEADRIYHHPTVPQAILDRARADAMRIPADEPPEAPGPGLSLWLEVAL